VVLEPRVGYYGLALQSYTVDLEKNVVGPRFARELLCSMNGFVESPAPSVPQCTQNRRNGRTRRRERHQNAMDEIGPKLCLHRLIHRLGEG